MTILVDQETGEVTGLTLQNRAVTSMGVDETALFELSARSKDLTHEIKSDAHFKEYGRAKSALVSARNSIEAKGKAARDDATAFSKAVIAEQKRLIAILEPEENRLQAKQDVWTDAKRRIELEALAIIEAKNAAIRELDAKLDHNLQFGDTAARISLRLAQVEAIELNDEVCGNTTRRVEMDIKKLTTINTLKAALDVASKNEALAAQLAAMPNVAPNPIQLSGEMREIPISKPHDGTDVQKLIAWAQSLAAVPLPELKTSSGAATLIAAAASLSKLIRRIEAAAVEL